ncbi:DUF3558 domain-containing protein [Crossiella sp. CA198]|uniref:DUF3558 domain-containing protein n=1 Tax=Crossiella sp. CA198 TaxID=3455607 RepID=UPI003F8D46C9
MTRRGIRVLVAIGAVAGVVLAGCGGGQTPGTTTTSASGAPTSSPAPSDVPTVPSPDLDTSRFAANPCGLLTTDQAKQVAGGVRGDLRESPLGPSCRWLASSTPVKNHFSVTVNNQLGGLAQLYARKSDFKVWQPAQVAGQPAVIAMDADVRDKGVCVLEIGTAQQTTVAIDVRLSLGAPDYANACRSATGIGEMVIATLKGGS